MHVGLQMSGGIAVYDYAKTTGGRRGTTVYVFAKATDWRLPIPFGGSQFPFWRLEVVLGVL